MASLLASLSAISICRRRPGIQQLLGLQVKPLFRSDAPGHLPPMRLKVFFERDSHGFCASLRLFGDFAQPVAFVPRHRKGATGEYGNGFGVQSCGGSKLLPQLSPYLVGRVFLVPPVAALLHVTSSLLRHAGGLTTAGRSGFKQIPDCSIRFGWL
jgi:hypothetical protein